MKRYLVHIICFLFLLPIAGSAQQSYDSSYLTPHYRQRTAFFKQLKHGKKEIIFLGNSITEAGQWVEITGNARVRNRGISGDVSFGVLARIDELLLHKPAKILLMIGVNDLKRGLPQEVILANYRKIIERVKALAPGTELVLQSVLPVQESMLGESYRKITNAAISTLNTALSELARQSGLRYADVASVMRDEKGSLKKEFTYDGIHLWPSAYLAWVQYLKLQKIL